MSQRWGAGEAAARFDTPALHQIETPVLVIDDDESVTFDVPATFPAVVCADAAVDSPLGRSVDVVGDIETLSRGIVTHPQAATTLAQLLRVSVDMEPSKALLAESLAYATLQSGAEFDQWLSSRGRRVRPPSDESPILVDESADDVTITLNRPRLRNALDAQMRTELREALLALGTGNRPITLRGAGKAFCIGGDLAEFGSVSDPATAHQLRMAGNLGVLLLRVADRLNVVVHGASVGAGVELAAFASRIIARPDATFRLPEVSMGLIPGAGGTVSIPARIGAQRTLWLALCDEEIDAATALSWGLIDEIGDET